MVTSMLEKAIEIEGLLRIIRDGNPLPETYVLLKNKAAQLAELTASLKATAGIMEHDAQNADFIMAPSSPVCTNAPEVTFTVQDPARQEDKFIPSEEILTDFHTEYSEALDGDLALIEEDDILLTFEDGVDFSISSAPTEGTETLASEENPYGTESPKEEMEPSDEDSSEHSEEEEPQETDDEEPAEDNEEEPREDESLEAEEKNTEAAEEQKDKSPEQAKRQLKLKSVFSLNDRFLYARELFEGNMKMFDSTLEFIEGIEDYSIIEDYFYSELEWDPESSNVAAFMELIRPYFKSGV